MKPSMILFLFVLFQSVSVYAGNGGGVGNGGDAVVCRDSSGSIRSVEALDRYEARTLFGMKARAKSKTQKEAVAEFLGRLAKYSPLRAAEYLEWAKEFDENAEFLYGQELIDIPDSEHVSFPRGCGVEQLVIQKVPKFAEEKRYTVNGDIWNTLSGVDQAIVVVHEMILREMINVSRAPIQTRELRYLNAKLFSGEFETMSYDDVFDLMQKVPNLEFDEHPDVQGRMSKRENDEGGRLRANEVNGERKYFFTPSPLRIPERFQCFLRGYPIPMQIGEIEIGPVIKGTRFSLVSAGERGGTHLSDDYSDRHTLITIRALGDGKFEAENLEGLPYSTCRFSHSLTYVEVHSFEVVAGKIVRIRASDRYPWQRLKCGEVVYVGDGSEVERDGEFRPIGFHSVVVNQGPPHQRGNAVSGVLKISDGKITSESDEAEMTPYFSSQNSSSWIKFRIDLSEPLDLNSSSVVLAEDICFRARNGHKFPRNRFKTHRFKKGERFDVVAWNRFSYETYNAFRPCK